MIEENKTYLITTDNWFFAPDGKQYKAVWGIAKMFEAKKELGFNPNPRSANWFVKIGTENNHILIAGCQIHYFIRTDERPNQLLGKYKDKETDREFQENSILILE